MDDKKKLEMLEEIMEMDEGELAGDMRLDEIDAYTSMAKLALIVLVNDEFSKKLTNEQLKTFVTVQDILDYMG